MGRLAQPWSDLSGITFSGYEIRHGQSAPCGAIASALPDGLGWVSGPVLGVYLHGMFESVELTRALLGTAPAQSLDQAINELTDQVIDALDEQMLAALAGVLN